MNNMKLDQKLNLCLTVIFHFFIFSLTAQENLKVKSEDLFIKCFIKNVNNNLDSTKFCFWINNVSDSDMFFFNLDFYPAIRKVDTGYLYYFSNFITDSEGKILLKGLNPNDTAIIEYSVNNLFHSNNIKYNFNESSNYFNFELLYLKINISKVNSKLTIKKELEVGRFYYLDLGKTISISNY